MESSCLNKKEKKLMFKVMLGFGGVISCVTWHENEWKKNTFILLSSMIYSAAGSESIWKLAESHQEKVVCLRFTIFHTGFSSQNFKAYVTSDVPKIFFNNLAIALFTFQCPLVCYLDQWMYDHVIIQNSESLCCVEFASKDTLVSSFYF